MPRPKNPACLRCATESIEEAQAKPCWKGQACRSKRSYYAKHSLNKAKKRSRQHSERARELDIPLFGHHPAPEVLMTFYRDRADGPIHALAFAVIDQGETLTTVKAIHLKGVPQAKLRSHIKSVLGILNTQLGPELLVSQSRQPASLCPLCLQDEKHEAG